MRDYYVDQIDDAADEPASITIQARDDDDARKQARDLVAAKGWDAAEVWDIAADMFVAEVSA